jgi:hypothetical protein
MTKNGLNEKTDFVATSCLKNYFKKGGDKQTIIEYERIGQCDSMLYSDNRFYFMELKKKRSDWQKRLSSFCTITPPKLQNFLTKRRLLVISVNCIFRHARF